MIADIELYEKNVINQLIEFISYYIGETIQEAKVYRDLASKPKIDVADMRLAISCKSYDSFVRPAPLSTIRNIARQKNQMPIPAIENLTSEETGKPNQHPNTIPSSTEATTLINPNL